MNLDLYRLPLGLTKGVEIPLPQTDIVFTVMLPGNTNEEFSSNLMAKMNSLDAIHKPEKTGDEDIIQVDPALFSRTRQELFFDTCIISIKNLPEDMDASKFFDEYPLAKKYLMRKANELASEADEQVNGALEKLLPTQNGKSFGKVGKPNMKNSSAMASQ